ncbi:ATP-binding protein [Streptomyces sp. NPDC048643]|uniref:ATP-binding protein n=1 Tax=Streptomyces sp. NPDC048643 TaxID=3155637 RepID=UPI00341DB3EC
MTPANRPPAADGSAGADGSGESDRRESGTTNPTEAPQLVTLAEPSAPPPTAERAVTSAATARRHVQTVLREHRGAPAGGVNQEAVIDLLLVVSELVTNAIRHGDGLAGFEAALTDGGVRLEVRDRSDVVPIHAYGTGEVPQHRQPNGYGWPLIIRLSRDITIEPCPGGGKSIRVFVPLG